MQNSSVRSKLFQRTSPLIHVATLLFQEGSKEGGTWQPGSLCRKLFSHVDIDCQIKSVQIYLRLLQFALEKEIDLVELCLTDENTSKLTQLLESDTPGMKETVLQALDLILNQSSIEALPQFIEADGRLHTSSCLGSDNWIIKSRAIHLIKNISSSGK